jgi:hypothetical protein
MSDTPPEHVEIERARRDPRLRHGREAVVSDWRSAMQAAERVRRLADWGLHELRNSEDLERLRLAQSSRGPDDDTRALEAARQRAALAVAEAGNQRVELNAMTLVAMMSATDALVEELVPRAHEMLIEWRLKELMDLAAQQHPEAAARLGDDQLLEARRILIDALRDKFGEVDGAPRGTASCVGSGRWRRSGWPRRRTARFPTTWL